MTVSSASESPSTPLDQDVAAHTVVLITSHFQITATRVRAVITTLSATAKAGCKHVVAIRSAPARTLTLECSGVPSALKVNRGRFHGTRHHSRHRRTHDAPFLHVTGGSWIGLRFCFRLRFCLGYHEYALLL